MSDLTDQFRLAIAAVGLTPPTEIIDDGAIHRFSTNGKPTHKNGWYMLHTDGIAAGAFGDWREGFTQNWCRKADTSMTEAERFAHRERVKAMQRQRENDLAQRQQLAAVGALKRWAAATPCTEHGYLTRKGIQPHGAKIEGDKLLILSRYTVLSHESHADYESLVNSLMDEHLPAGATEQHLIEELASVIWRKRRVLQAEGATINKGLKESSRNAKTIIPAAAPFVLGLSGDSIRIQDVMDRTPEDVTESQKSARHDLDATNKAGAILRKGGDRAYGKALRALLPDTREWWQEYVDDEEYTADATGLAAFITEHVTPLVYLQEKEARHHDAIVNQALGEGLHAYKLEKLSRYETHLDRKFERTLAMLIKLKELRTSRTP